ncbi:MAG: NUDIX hydrolase [Gammaproteobacteria bacterium]|nr:NUDIX hydrolase [Gammaproteobacteria bacterium]
MNREIYNGRLIRLNRETVSLPNGRDVELDIVHHPGGAVVAALDEAENVCMLRQFRHAAGGVIWELPAGCIDPGDPDPLATARRELEEEAGLVARDWRELGLIYTTPGFCDEVLYLFLARGLEETRTDHGEDELIEIRWLPLANVIRMVMVGDIRDAKTVAGLCKAQAALAGPA